MMEHRMDLIVDTAGIKDDGKYVLFRRKIRAIKPSGWEKIQVLISQNK